jgi:hypothetical protein
MTPSGYHEVTYDFPGIGWKSFMLSGRYMVQEPDTAPLILLSLTVCLSDCIGVHQGDLQTVGVSPDSHRLIEIRQTHGNGAPGPACANNEDTNRLAAQEIRRQEMLNAHNDPLYRASRAA